MLTIYILPLQLLCIIVNEQSDIAAFANYVPSEADFKPAASAPAALAPAAAVPKPVFTPAAPVPASISSVAKSFIGAGIGSRIFASPLAKKLAAEKNIDLSSLGGSGSGPSGRIRAQDVLTASPVQQQATAGSAPSGAYQDTSITNIRQVIAKRLLMSKQTVPHYYLSVEIEVDELLK